MHAPDEQLWSVDIRFLAMKESFLSFLTSPLIGQGPGTIGKTMAFNPSLLTTLLEDTGILGFVVFLVFLFQVFRSGLKKISELDEKCQSTSFALSVALAGLFSSYIFTNGLWIPFTWVFMALAVASIKLDR